ncbi:MAG: carboxymuconolactone decarboxylase family protein [Acidobacteria bacterium]|nr:carboxymuconolactone decarboxylase family protein [Acidobacteriota bacterium]
MASAPLHGQTRLGAVPPDKLTAEHRAAMDAFKKARGVDVFGPFVPLLWSPEAMVRAGAMGDYLRYKSAFAPPLSEFIILLAARQWSQQYEWSVHYPAALKAGVDRAIVDAIVEGRRPPGMSAEQDMLFDFTTELTETKGVSDATYARVLARFGEKGVIDAISITGYYTLLAMVLNTVHTPPEPGVPLLPPLPR